MRWRFGRTTRSITTAVLLVLLPGLAGAAEIWIPPRAPAVDFAFGNWPLAGAAQSRFGFAVPADLKTFTDARVVVLSGQGGALPYDLQISVSQNDERHDLYTDVLSDSVIASTAEFVEIDVSSLIAAIPNLNPGVDYIGLTLQLGGQARPLGMRFVYDATSGPLHIVADVAGPLLAAGALGNEADPFVPEQHVAIIENTRATTNEAEEDRQNTGGLAIVLNSHGNDQIDLWDLDAYDPAQHVLNTINRNDHFVTFFRKGEDGSSDVVGRIEGLSFWDMGQISQQVIDFLADPDHAAWNWFDLDVTFNEPATWLFWEETPSLTHPGFVAPTFDDGAPPVFAFNNLNCEGNTDEVCIDLGALGEIDLTWNDGTLPKTTWGSMDDPLLGLQFSPGKLGGNPPIEFGSPFLAVDDGKVMDFVMDAQDLLGSIAPTAVEMKLSPVEFGVKHLFALNGGVTYESGSGDYAEWLERLDPDEELSVGDLVGVHGGRVSRKTEGADQVMVISYKPIVLGNMPQEDRAEHYEKVAFMGQTLVKVRGPVHQGDYIIPSGLEDGTGVAISPDAVSAAELSHVLGIAWSVALSNGPVGLANVAVGLRPVEVARVVRRQADELAGLRAETAAANQEVARLQQELGAVRAAMTELESLRGQLGALQAAVRGAGIPLGESLRADRDR